MAKARLQISVINIPLFHLLLSLLVSGREFCGHVEAIKYTEVRGLHIWLFAEGAGCRGCILRSCV